MVTDFHTHILPGIDDGSGSVEESIGMLAMEWAQGITRVIATPHFYARYDSPEAFLERRDRAEQQLRQAMTDRKDLPEVTVGAEVYYFRGISESDALSHLTIRQKRCILIEAPEVPWPEEFYRELEAIWVKRKILPILAHIDRYISPFRTYGIPERLAQLPVMVQANSSFFLDWRTSAMAMKMLKEDRIHLIGSDCHGLVRRTPDLGRALEKIRKKLGLGVLERIRGYENEILGDGP